MRDLWWAGPHSWAHNAALGLGAACLLLSGRVAAAQSLPESPGALLLQSQNGAGSPASREPDAPTAQAEGQHAAVGSQGNVPHCSKGKPAGSPPAGGPVASETKADVPCQEENPLQPITGAYKLPPLTPRQKGYLATRDVIDPFNLITILGYSAVTVGSNAHTAYGPGLRGFGRLTGYGLLEDVQGEFIGTFLIPTLAHQDPRYYRMPGQPFPKRLLHAVSHTVVTRGDDGSNMPNYATLLTYPISAELINLYGPGVADNAPSTAKRIGLGLATDPIGQIVAEFLPDVARRIHIRIIFVQQILQQVAQGSAGGPVMTQ